MSEERERRGCWRCGCFGCLALVIGGLVLFVLLGIAQSLRGARAPEVEEVESGLALPSEEQFEAWRRSGELGTRAKFSSSERGTAPSPQPQRVGRVRLDLTVGQYDIRRGEAGEGVRVEGTYEADAFELTESFQEEEGGAWSYRLALEPRGGFLRMLASGGGNDPDNRLTVFLPPDVPFDLSGTWGIGEVDADLGGLWIRDVDLEFGAGEHSVRFSEPTLAALESFRVEKSVGELFVDQLGNASPATAYIEQNFGELRVDLEGDWIGDADLEIRQSLGEIDIDAPNTARIEPQGGGLLLGDRSMNLEAGKGLPASAPTLRLRASGNLGEIRVDPPRRAPRPESSPAPSEPRDPDSP